MYPLEKMDTKSETITVNQSELKDFFMMMKKLANQNMEMKK